MHVVRNVRQNPRQRIVRRQMYLPSERMVVNGVGLGEVDGLFNIGKMFKRLVTVKKSSFKLKNIMGAIGSATMFTASGGLSTLAPKITGAHSKVSRIVGIGTTAVAAVAGAVVAAPAIGGALGIGGTAATGTGLVATGAESAASASALIASETAGTAAAGGGFFSAIGSGLSTVGSGLMTGLKALPLVGQIFSGGGGGTQYTQQVPYDPYAQDYINQQQQIANQLYAQEQLKQQQIAQAQAQMYMPGAIQQAQYAEQYPSMNTSYGDLRSPYTAMTEDGVQVQVDPKTGQVIQAGMIPDLSMTTWIVLGGATLLGWYFMSDSSKSNN